MPCWDRMRQRIEALLEEELAFEERLKASILANWFREAEDSLALGAGRDRLHQELHGLTSGELHIDQLLSRVQEYAMQESWE